MKIDLFKGPHHFLSNFYPSTLRWDGMLWPTLEHAFQAAKTLDKQKRLWVRGAFSPAEAKRRGRDLDLRTGWNDDRVGVMRELLRLKFATPSLRAQLVATGEAELVEGNTWGDHFWGVCRGTGENWLGRLLMEVRSEIMTPKEA